MPLSDTGDTDGLHSLSSPRPPQVPCLSPESRARRQQLLGRVCTDQPPAEPRL